MRLDRWSVAVFACSLLAAESSARPGYGSPVPTQWTGASASATFAGQSQTQQGASATATAGGTEPVGYWGSQYLSGDTTVYHVDLTGKFAAAAGTSPSQLLHVSGEGASPNPGLLYDGPFNPTSAGAAASWSNDAVIVSAPSGASLPSMVRLNFALTATAPIETEWDYTAGAYATITAMYNGTSLKYMATSTNNPWQSPSATWGGAVSPGGINAAPGNSQAVDSSANSRDVASDTSFVKETFHIDVPINKSGVSAPFSLGLQLLPLIGLVSDEAYAYSGLAANVALTGITLPDGTPLSSLGDSASLVSGLSAPSPVPEPASVALWAMAATGAAIAAVRRTQRRS